VHRVPFVQLISILGYGSHPLHGKVAPQLGLPFPTQGLMCCDGLPEATEIGNRIDAEERKQRQEERDDMLGWQKGKVMLEEGRW
jgi:hypothetical protein